MLNLLRLFAVLLSWSKAVRGSRPTIFVATAAGAIAGICSTALIAVINGVLSTAGSPRRTQLLEFVILCVIVPLAGFLSQALLIRLTARAAHELRIQLSRQILGARYRLVEKLGPARLLATITDDIPTVTTAFSNIPLLVMQSAIMAACVIYLGWLSWPLLLLMLASMLAGLLSYHLPMRKATHYFNLMREEWDALFKAIRALTEGSKELRLHRARRNEFFSQQLKPAADGLEQYGIRGSTLSLAATNWGQILYFVFIGVVLFVIPQFFSLERRIMTGYTLTVLYMISPLSVMLNLLPTFAKAYVGAEKIKSLGLSLSTQHQELPVAPVEPQFTWQRLDLVGVTHSYQSDGGADEFQLGPLDLTFCAGELTFLIGGNGSGKTTLAKVIMGLYEPEKGQILFDGKPVTSENRDDYRQQFSVVFSDFFLFDRLYGISRENAAGRSREYLLQLQLEHKVQIDDGTLSTVELSQGQRKRLALLTAYLEDRPIYVFDEWASDQDPLFKQIFYYDILPELKSRGKTVIVISHDDHYYHVADRLIKLERGQLESDRRTAVPRTSIAGTAFRH